MWNNCAQKASCVGSPSVASLNSTMSRTWQKLQKSEKKSLTHVSVVESLLSLLLAKNDQSPGARVFRGVKVYGSQLCAVCVHMFMCKNCCVSFLCISGFRPMSYHSTADGWT